MESALAHVAIDLPLYEIVRLHFDDIPDDVALAQTGQHLAGGHFVGRSTTLALAIFRHGFRPVVRRVRGVALRFVAPRRSRVRVYVAPAVDLRIPDTDLPEYR